MSERRRSGGRAGRQAARLARHIETVPYLTRTLAPVEVMSMPTMPCTTAVAPCANPWTCRSTSGTSTWSPPT